MDAVQVVKALRKRHGGGKAREWAFFDELRVGTGYRATYAVPGTYEPNNPEQRIDAWAINLWPSKNFLKIAYEVKVSRSDFLHELAQPQKRAQALAVSNQFYFATPAGLVKPEEIPPECGIVEVMPDGSLRETVKAPIRVCEGPSWQFLASIARRTASEDAQVRLWA